MRTSRASRRKKAAAGWSEVEGTGTWRRDINGFVVDRKAATRLYEILLCGAIGLADKFWLRDYYMTHIIARRQELPGEALRDFGDSASKADINRSVMVVSHGWLHRDHPDPTGARRNDLARICSFRSFRGGSLFWDFISLFQAPRTRDEHKLFQQGLNSMHLVFSNPRWFVVRLIHTPTFVENNVPNDRRGWCFFESTVANIGCYEVYTLENGQDCKNATPVPLLPESFNEILDDKIFVSDMMTSIW